MSNTSGSAAKDLLEIYWRHHDKSHLPPGLMGKRAAGQDLTQLANECCSAMALLLQEPVLDVVTVPAPKQALEARRDERKRQHLRADCQRLTLLLEKVMAELSGDEWYYFWGLHQMFDILPQTMEEI